MVCGSGAREGAKLGVSWRTWTGNQTQSEKASESLAYGTPESPLRGSSGSLSFLTPENNGRCVSLLLLGVAFRYCSLALVILMNALSSMLMEINLVNPSFSLLIPFLSAVAFCFCCSKFHLDPSVGSSVSFSWIPMERVRGFWKAATSDTLFHCSIRDRSFRVPRWKVELRWRPDDKCRPEPELWKANVFEETRRRSDHESRQ